MTPSRLIGYDRIPKEKEEEGERERVGVERERGVERGRGRSMGRVGMAMYVLLYEFLN